MPKIVSFSYFFFLHKWFHCPDSSPPPELKRQDPSFLARVNPQLLAKFSDKITPLAPGLKVHSLGALNIGLLFRCAFLHENHKDFCPPLREIYLFRQRKPFPFRSASVGESQFQPLVRTYISLVLPKIDLLFRYDARRILFSSRLFATCAAGLRRFPLLGRGEASLWFSSIHSDSTSARSSFDFFDYQLSRMLTAPYKLLGSLLSSSLADSGGKALPFLLLPLW